MALLSKLGIVKALFWMRGHCFNNSYHSVGWPVLSMGTGISACHRLPRPSPQVPYFLIMFQMPCGIRLGLADEATIDTVRKACYSAATQEGIEFDGKLDDDSYKIRLRGTPFALASDHKDALISRKVAVRMLQELYTLGWTLVASSDLSRSDDLSTWFFRRECIERKPARIICVGLSSSDTLQMVGDFDDSLKIVLKSAVESGYVPGLQSEREVQSEYYELKLHGYPWAGNCTREEGIWARRCLLQIIRYFHHRLFKFYGTVNLKGTADALFFIEQEIDFQKVDRTNTGQRGKTRQRQRQGKNEMKEEGRAHFSALSLDRKDRLTLIDPTPELIECVRDAILNYWKGGLQGEKSIQESKSVTEDRFFSPVPASQSEIGTAKEFKMKGYPWWVEGLQTVRTRYFMSKLFQSILAHGHAVIGALDISRQYNDKAVFLLRSHSALDLPHVCLSMHDSDKMRLINHSDVIPVENISSTVQAMWPYGMADHNEDVLSSYLWTLKHEPWSSHGRSNKPLIARVLMCYVLRAFLERGWTLLASADISAKYVACTSGPDFSCDVDSWFFADTRRVGGLFDKLRL